jgi:chemotaxis protein MotB
MTAWDGQIKHPIIVRKVTRKHEERHGGAWKVAYADFVTAMMALFIVLWLLNTDDSTRKAVAGYFRDPSGSSSGTGSGAAGSGESLSLGKDDMSKLKEHLEGVLKQLPDFQKLSGQVQMTVTGEGLRVELLESETGVFFETGNAQPTGSGMSLLTSMADELGKLSNKIAIEGHTDSRPFAGHGQYTNWELAVDRANTARRLMQTSGLRADQVTQVRGFADQRLKTPQAPEDPSNRRVSIVVQYKFTGAGST